MKMDRSKALVELARKQIAEISVDERREILEGYWWPDSVSDIRDAIDSDDFPAISDSLADLITETEEPTNILSPDMDPLLMDWFVTAVNVRALNSYIEEKLKTYGADVEVTGEYEEGQLCPCCGYYSLGVGEDALWDICTVCFWENGGDSPNHMKLATAQANFARIGAMGERFLDAVAPDGKRMFRKHCPEDV